MTAIGGQASVNSLLERLRSASVGRGDPMTLFIVSLAPMPTHNATPEFWLDLNKILLGLKSRYNASLYELTPNDRAILVKTTDMTQIGIVSDLKLDLLRLIQEYFPDFFGMVDQNRMLRTIDLRTRLQKTIKSLERFQAEENEDNKDTPTSHRRLHNDDIAKVEKLHKKVGGRDFSKMFVRDQKVALIKPGEPAKNFMKEYFVGMETLKQHAFSDVELRGSGNVFNQLTVLLDRLLLNGFDHINPNGEKCSINLNVETVFTYAFKNFLERIPPEDFANILFEFRQENILQHFDEFEMACNLIHSRKGLVAVDAIFPETVGIVNLNRLNINMAKIFWRQGAEKILPERKKDILEIIGNETEITLARVDDEAGVAIGQSLGIFMFQGFYIDGLMPNED